MHVKVRHLKSGHTSERSLDELGNLEEVPAETRNMQYLYASNDGHVFMDTESFEQYTLPREVLGDAVPFLVEEETYRFLAIDGQPVSAQLPTHVVLTIANTAPPEHGGGGSSVLKEARLASGLVIHVPLFIRTGDKVRVKTDTREYLGKEH